MASVQRMDSYVVPDPVLVADLDVQQAEEAEALVIQAADVLGGEQQGATGTARPSPPALPRSACIA